MSGGVAYVYKRPGVRFLVGLYDRCGALLRRRVASPLAAPPRRVCAIVLNQIGDAVMALPAIDAVMGLCPGTRLTVVSGQAVAPLLRARDWDVEIREFDAPWQKVVRQLLGRPRSALEIARAMKAFRRLLDELDPDAALAFQPDLVVNGLLGRARVRHTFGFVDAGSGFWLEHPVAMPSTGHQVERLFALAQALAAALGVAPAPVAGPRLRLRDRHVSMMAARLAAAGVDPRHVVVLHPFASAAPKNWSMDRWRSVAEWLAVAGLRPFVVGGRRDDVAAAGIGSAIDLGGPLDLAELAALLSLARLFVGVDSGPGHIAAAVGCPVVTIFSGVNHVERWRPYGNRAPVVVLHRPVEDRRRFPYEVRALPPGVPGNPYTDGIAVEDVTVAIRRLAAAARSPR